MPDIFLSYSSEDVDKARLFADALAASGYDVWWDAALRLGDPYDQLIERALRDSRVVVVLWSADAVKSRWVRAEATLADRLGKLVPACIAQCDPPLVFGLAQTADLSGWKGNVADDRWRRFLDDLRERLAPDAARGSQSPADAGRRVVLALPSKPSIAVLPFKTLNEDQAWLADGLVEEISGALSRFETLFVIAGASSLTFREHKPNLLATCEQLGVRYILQGSVRCAGDRVRIMVTLSDGIEGEQIWSDRFEDRLEDVFQLQDRIATAVAARIDSSIDTAELKRVIARPAASPDAMELYWRANAIFRHGDPASIKEAIALTTSVLALEPDNAWAMSLRGFCHALLFANGWGADLAAERAAALDCCERAMRSGGEDVRVLGYVGAAMTCAAADLEVATQLIDRTLELNPGSATTLFWGGWNDFFMARYERALERFSVALRLNPRSIVRPVTLAGMGCCLFAQGRHGEAARALQESVLQMPEFPAALAALSASLVRAGRMEDAHVAATKWEQAGRSYGVLFVMRDRPMFQQIQDGLAAASRAFEES